MIKNIFLLCTLLSIAPPLLAATPWQKQYTPVKGKAHSIGGYSNGCIIGAQKLPLTHAGYQVMKPNRLRNFGHPNLVHFIEQLANNTKKKQLGTVLVGDMGMPVGGRFSSGHASHQTGLDVDIWLQLPNKRWSEKQLTSPKAINLVNSSGKKVVASRWSPQLSQLVKLAATDKQVTRIFVHPAIKQQLCEDAGNHRSWLNKVRPWFGHRAHMHVRLTCPTDSRECLEQDTIPAGDGCGEELASWLKMNTSLMRIPIRKNRQNHQKYVNNY